MKRMLLIAICLVGHGVNYAVADDDHEEYHEDVSEAMEEYNKDMNDISNPMPPMLGFGNSKYDQMDIEHYHQQQYYRNQEIDSANKEFRERMIDINQEHEDHHHH